jgi:hypothetical protein
MDTTPRRKFQNLETQRMHENKEASKQAAKHSEPDGDEAAPAGDEEPIENVVDEHGPADEVEITSKHGKHKHKSVHHDAASAKEHVSKAFGEESEPAEGEGEQGGGESYGGGGGGIPTMGGGR